MIFNNIFINIIFCFREIYYKKSIVERIASNISRKSYLDDELSKTDLFKQTSRALKPKIDNNLQRVNITGELPLVAPLSARTYSHPPQLAASILM